MKDKANKCSMELLEEKTFFPEALKMLGKKLSFVTKVQHCLDLIITVWNI